MTNEEFEELWMINPTGAKSSLFLQVENILQEERCTFSGKKITIEFIKEKYIQYLKWWDITYGDREPKFIAKTDQKVNLSIFLAKQMYEQEFVVALKKRDKYLFGENQISVLELKLNKFFIKIGYVRQEEITFTQTTDKPF